MSLFDSGSKGVKFTNVGDTVTGTVAGAPTERQQTKYGTQEPAFWPNGDPMMQIIVPLVTTLRETPDDDGERTLYVASKNMKRAIGDAIREAGASDIVKGGTLTVRFVGNDPASRNPQNPAKMYVAQYTAPASAFATTQAATAPVVPVAPQQAFIPQTPQPTAPSAPMPASPAPAQPVAPVAPGAQQWLTEQQVAQLQQLRAAGIPEETIAPALGVTVDTLRAFDASNTPF